MGFIWASGFLEFFLLFLGIYQMRTESESSLILLSDRLISVFIFVSAETLVITSQILITENPPGTFAFKQLGFFPRFETGIFATLFAGLSLIALARTFVVIRTMVHQKKAIEV